MPDGVPLPTGVPMKSLSEVCREARRLGVPLKVLRAIVRETWTFMRNLSPDDLQRLTAEVEYLRTVPPERIVAQSGSLHCTTCGHRELLTEDVVRASK